MADFANKVIDFYSNLQPDIQLPQGFSIMNPYEDHETMALTKLFYKKYFSDKEKRVYIFGINPGRFGGGITGIPFTDPLHLKEMCGIDHHLPLKKELSALFIAKMIEAFGGTEVFYQKFFLTAVCPLGFIRQNINANYYDDASLIKATRPFIIKTMQQQVDFGCLTNLCFCLGQGKNYEHLQALNNSLGIFNQIIPLPHPRWIMQYRRNSVEEFISQYVTAFSRV